MTSLAYIGNFRPAASTENEIRRALDALGHDVTLIQEDDVDAWEHVPDWEADLILWTRTKSLSDRVPIELRWQMLDLADRAGIPTVGYHLDRWWGLSRQHEIREDPFFRVSLLCTADGGHDAAWKDAGVNHAWFPPAISEFEVGLGQHVDEYDCDVAFVGSWQSYGHPEWEPHRLRMLDAVRSWYGDRFCCFPEAGRERVTGMDLRDLYASCRVVVGDSCLAPDVNGQPITRYWSDRVPETIGRGGLLVHPYVEGIDDDERGVRGPWWLYSLGDLDQLHAVIETVLRLPDERRERLRSDAVRWTLKGDTYTARMRQLLERLGL